MNSSSAAASVTPQMESGREACVYAPQVFIAHSESQKKKKNSRSLEAKEERISARSQFSASPSVAGMS